jgi:hypothetical protein
VLGVIEGRGWGLVRCPHGPLSLPGVRWTGPTASCGCGTGSSEGFPCRSSRGAGRGPAIQVSARDRRGNGHTTDQSPRCTTASRHDASGTGELRGNRSQEGLSSCPRRTAAGGGGHRVFTIARNRPPCGRHSPGLGWSDSTVPGGLEPAAGASEFVSSPGSPCLPACGGFGPRGGTSGLPDMEPGSSLLRD